MINNFLNSSLIFGLGFVFLRGVSFLLLPLYTNLLSTFDAGAVFIVYSTLAFLNPIYSFGMDAALFKFFNSEKHTTKTIISTSVLSVVVYSLVLSCLIYSISCFWFPLMNLEYNWLSIVSIVLFFDALSSRLLVVLRLLNMPLYYLGVGFINIVSSIVFNVLFIQHYSLGNKGAVFALVSTAIIQFIFLIPVFLRHINWRFFNSSLGRQMFWFGIPFFPASILFILTSVIDRFFIKHFVGLEDVGIYGAGYKIGSIVSIVVVAFNLTWQPYYLKRSKDENFLLNIRLISQKFFIVLLYLATSISVWSPQIVKINIQGHYIIGPAFWDAVNIVPWIAFGYFFYGLFILQMPTIYLKNKQKWSPFFWGLGALLNIILNYVLIPRLGIVGAAVSTFISFFIMFVLIKYKNQQWMSLNFINRPLIGFFVLSFFIGSVMKSASPFSWNSVLAFSVYSFVAVYFLFSKKVLCKQ